MKASAPPSPNLRLRTGGYTLVELLVVMALMAVLMAILGIGLRNATAGPAIDAVDGLVRTQLTIARARAALDGRPAALAVPADPSDDRRYLRELGVAAQTASGEWELVDDVVQLAGGIRMLTPAEGASLWNPAPADVRWGAAVGSVPAHLVRFSPTGILLETGGGELGWIDPADNSQRGALIVSRYGAIGSSDSAADSVEETP